MADRPKIRRTRIIFNIALLAIATAAVVWRRSTPTKGPLLLPPPPPTAVPAPTPLIDDTRHQMLELLNQSEDGRRTLALPSAKAEASAPAMVFPSAPRPSPSATPEPFAVAITLETGSFLVVRKTNNPDLYDASPLAMPDIESVISHRWDGKTTTQVAAQTIHVFKDESAQTFVETTEPVTLGTEPNFSMISFYERGRKNPDAEVRRLMGRRMVRLVSLHEEYSGLWTPLYRDLDSRVRTEALAEMNLRGVHKSRAITDDLLVRLTELTKTRAEGEREQEIILIIDILRDSLLPRVQAALGNFAEAWKGKQNEKILEALR